MPSIQLNGKSISYTVRESSKASRSRIEVDPSGVTVTVPEHRNLDPAQFLHERKDWVVEKYQDVKTYIGRIPDRDLKHGGAIPLLGEPHPIQVVDVDQHQIENGTVRLSEQKVSDSTVEDELEELLREEARARIHEIIEKYDDAIKGTPGTVYIRNQKTKWGSCSSKGNLSFNWRLVMAPEHVLEYVVVHELVHLETTDHSKKFWRRVEELMPEYRESREWLEENSPQLVFSKEDIA